MQVGILFLAGFLDFCTHAGYTSHVAKASRKVAFCGRSIPVISSCRAREETMREIFGPLFNVVAAYLIFEAVMLIIYLPRLRFWIYGFFPQKRFTAKRTRKIAVIVPARDESKSIPPLLRSLNEQDYPADSFDIYIVIKHPDDPTVRIVQDMLPRAEIITVENQRIKAEALDYGIREALGKGIEYDGFAVVDADCILDASYLTEINRAAESGAKVIIPAKRIKNRMCRDKRVNNLISDCSGMTYIALDRMGNKAKSRLGYTLSLCGQGMYIDGDFIRELHGYPFRSITEDYEIAGECMRRGYAQYYCDSAVVYSEEPVEISEYDKRRVRWIQGFLQFGHMYGKETRRASFGKGGIRHLHFVYGLVPVGVILAGSILMFLAMLFTSAWAYAMGNRLLTSSALWAATVPFILSYIEFIVFALFELLLSDDRRCMTAAERLRFVFLSPFVQAGYIPVFLRAFFGKGKEWTPVKRVDIPKEAE